MTLISADFMPVASPAGYSHVRIVSCQPYANPPTRENQKYCCSFYFLMPVWGWLTYILTFPMQMKVDPHLSAGLLACYTPPPEKLTNHQLFVLKDELLRNKSSAIAHILTFSTLHLKAFHLCTSGSIDAS